MTSSVREVVGKSRFSPVDMKNILHYQRYGAPSRARTCDRLLKSNAANDIFLFILYLQGQKGIRTHSLIKIYGAPLCFEMAVFMRTIIVNNWSFGYYHGALCCQFLDGREIRARFR